MTKKNQELIIFTSNAENEEQTRGRDPKGFTQNQGVASTDQKTKTSVS